MTCRGHPLTPAARLVVAMLARQTLLMTRPMAAAPRHQKCATTRTLNRFNTNDVNGGMNVSALHGPLQMNVECAWIVRPNVTRVCHSRRRVFTDRALVRRDEPKQRHRFLHLDTETTTRRDV